MAKYVGLLTSDMRGKTGGITWSHNASGNFARRTTIPRDPKTPIQTRYREKLSYLSQTWRAFSPQVQSNWVTLASQYPLINSLKKTYYLTGFQMYMCLGLRLITNGFTLFDYVPVIGNNTFPDIADIAINIDTTPGTEDILLSFTATLPTNKVIMLESTTVVSHGVTSPKGFRHFGYVDHTFVSGASIMNQYLAKFTIMPSTGDVVWFRAFVMDSVEGWVSPRVKFSAVGTI